MSFRSVGPTSTMDIGIGLALQVHSLHVGSTILVGIHRLSSRRFLCQSLQLVYSMNSMKLRPSITHLNKSERRCLSKRRPLLSWDYFLDVLAVPNTWVRVKLRIWIPFLLVFPLNQSPKRYQASIKTHTQTHRHTDTQTHTHTTKKQKTDTQRHTHTHTHTRRHTDTQTHRHADTQTHRHTDTQTHTHTHKTHTHTPTHTHTHAHTTHTHTHTPTHTHTHFDRVWVFLKMLALRGY